MSRLIIGVNSQADGTCMLTVTRAAPGAMALAAQRPTRAECNALAERVVAAVQVLDARAQDDARTDLLDLIHAAFRAE